MYIIVESIPQNGDDYISIQIREGNTSYYNCMATEVNIYVMLSWEKVIQYLAEKGISWEASPKNADIDFWILSKKCNIMEW